MPSVSVRASGEWEKDREMTDIEKRLKEKLNSQGFDYLGGYENKKSVLTIRCRTCGDILNRKVDSIRHKDDRVTCFNCQHLQTLEREAQKKAERARIKAERGAERLANNPLGLSAYQLERSKVLDDPHVCKVCGKTYTMREYIKSAGIKYKRVSGYCSAECKRLTKRQRERERRKNGKHENGKHYSRARKLGLPRERGITLKKLIDRDGLQCHICGLICVYDGDGKGDLYPSIDHLLPIARGGGHTWDNVRIAHRRCNSVKADRVLASNGTYIRTGPKERARQPSEA